MVFWPRRNPGGEAGEAFLLSVPSRDGRVLASLNVYRSSGGADILLFLRRLRVLHQVFQCLHMWVDWDWAPGRVVVRRFAWLPQSFEKHVRPVGGAFLAGEG